MVIGILSSNLLFILISYILYVYNIYCNFFHSFFIHFFLKTKFDAGEEPDNIDKEFLRKWFVSQCDPYADLVLPTAPQELVVELSRRYIMLYEIITGNIFNFNLSSDYISLEDMENSIIKTIGN